ncbi:MAG: helix-turn-helix transcriptional regulator [Acidobacteriaceae bacterium]
MQAIKSFDAQSLQEVTVRLFEAAAAPDLLPEALDSVRQWLDCDFFHFLTWDTESAELHRSLQSQEMTQPLVGYAAHYGKLDPRRPISDAGKVGEVFACQHHFDGRFVSRSEFYQDYLIPIDARWIMGGPVLRQGSCVTHFALNHRKERGEFSEAKINAFQRFMPTLQNVVQLLHRMDGLANVRHAAESGLEAWGKGLIALSPTHQLDYANEEARKWINPRGLFGLAGGKLIGLGSVQSNLVQAITRVRVNAQPVHFIARAQFDDRHRPHLVGITVVAAPAVKTSVLGTRMGFAVLIEELHPQRRVNDASLMEWFGLTPAEARVASWLSSGEAPASIARLLNVAVPTVRSQIRRILEQTDCANLQELQRLLARLPRD